MKKKKLEEKYASLEILYNNLEDNTSKMRKLIEDQQNIIRAKDHEIYKLRSKVGEREITIKTIIDVL